MEEKNGGEDFELEYLEQIKDTAHELIKLPLPPKVTRQKRPKSHYDIRRPNLE